MLDFNTAHLGAFLLGCLLFGAAWLVSRLGPSQPIRGRTDWSLVLGTVGGVLAACSAVVAAFRAGLWLYDLPVHFF